jgi:hypothetical protein
VNGGNVVGIQIGELQCVNQMAFARFVVDGVAPVTIVGHFPAAGLLLLNADTEDASMVRAPLLVGATWTFRQSANPVLVCLNCPESRVLLIEYDWSPQNIASPAFQGSDKLSIGRLFTTDWTIVVSVMAIRHPSTDTDQPQP